MQTACPPTTTATPTTTYTALEPDGFAAGKKQGHGRGKSIIQEYEQPQQHSAVAKKATKETWTGAAAAVKSNQQQLQCSIKLDPNIGFFQFI